MLQAILTRHKLRFIVAPYSAWAQVWRDPVEDLSCD
jgi:hypothetical protein